MKREDLIAGIDTCRYMRSCLRCPLYPHRFDGLCDSVQELVENCSEATVDQIQTIIREVE